MKIYKINFFLSVIRFTFLRRYRVVIVFSILIPWLVAYAGIIINGLRNTYLTNNIPPIVLIKNKIQNIHIPGLVVDSDVFSGNSEDIERFTNPYVAAIASKYGNGIGMTVLYSESGWPHRFVHGGVVPSLQTATYLSFYSHYGPIRRTVIPYGVHIRGYIINIIFFVSVNSILFVLYYMILFIKRAKENRCAYCGYAKSLTGSICSECGNVDIAV